MKTDDLLCSRNARPQKALVGRAQLRIDQATLLRSSKEGREKMGYVSGSVYP
jgi:hypothetical protein